MFSALDTHAVARGESFVDRFIQVMMVTSVECDGLHEVFVVAGSVAFLRVMIC